MNTIASAAHTDTLALPRSAMRLLATDASWAQALLRVTFAAVLWPHGAQHLLGWFGGSLFAGTLAWMTDTLGFPALIAASGIAYEFFGPPWPWS